MDLKYGGHVMNEYKGIEHEANRLTDPREIRKRITDAAWRTGSRIDGQATAFGSVNIVGAMIHEVLYLAERDGLSGEDTMTLLAYHALLRYEEAIDRLMSYAANYPSPGAIRRE